MPKSLFYLLISGVLLYLLYLVLPEETSSRWISAMPVWIKIVMGVVVGVYLLADFGNALYNTVHWVKARGSDVDD